MKLNIINHKNSEPLSFAYPCDNYVNDILSNRMIRKTLQLFANKYYNEQIQNIKSSAQLVTRSNYPYLCDLLKNCYNSLNVQEAPEVYISSRLKGINALSLGSDNDPIILISRKAVISLTEGELQFLIGHELGHILQKNLMCHTIKGLLDKLNKKSEILGPIVSDLIEVPLNKWYRCAEYTADRAGLICCKDLDHVYSLIRKIAGIERISIAPSLMEIYRDHPYLDSRIKTLEEYNFNIKRYEYQRSSPRNNQ